MNKAVFRFSMLIGILFCFYAKSIDWSGDITADVIDQNITITGNCTIVGPGIMPTGQISVSAIDQNITVSATNTFFIQGKSGGESDLYFYAAEDKTISFNVNHDFDFKGSPDGTDMLVTFSGLGQLIFNLADRVSLKFTSKADSGGIKFMVRMQKYSNYTEEPEDGIQLPMALIFDRQNKNSDENVEIVIGPKSLLSYISSTTTEYELGSIAFIPTNNSNHTGRMILKIEDTGGIYVGGNLVQNIPNPQLANIDMNSAAGMEAVFSVINNYKNDYSFAGLLVLNENKTLTDLFIDPWFSGLPVINRYGFVLGDKSLLFIRSNTYLDYVGLANNICPEPNIPEPILMGKPVSSVVKKRNPSALIVDGIKKSVFPARIFLGSQDNPSALYLRSGVDKNGTINYENLAFTVDNTEKTPGEGEIVCAIEGILAMGSTTTGAVQLLSLEVTPTGGSVLMEENETNFPLRTFQKDGSGDYISYNKACMFINNSVIGENLTLIHTDENHVVCENSALISEPTYIGGESYKLDPTQQWPHPIIGFSQNSSFYIHTSAAFTGVDILISADDYADNNRFIFFGNGYKIDNGSGRNLILGTKIGSTACNGCTIIDEDTQFLIMDGEAIGAEATSIRKKSTVIKNEDTASILSLQTGCNNNKIVENVESQFVCGPCQDEPSIHTIYLGNASNIQIGSNYNEIKSVLSIEGNYFSFATRGGTQCCPQLSSITGEGGIFVDQYGKITIDPCYRVNFSTMVIQGGNGEIDLPPSNVFFNNKVGVTKAPLDLSTDTIIVDKGEKISDYTIVWPELKKDYGKFCPYVVPCVPECYCPVITTSNLGHVPTVKGEVGQLQIQGATFANRPHVKVDGGHVREFVFFKGCKSGEAAAAVIILKNDAEVGLGSAHVNKDSLNASVVLGINGITIIAEAGEGDVDNDGRVNLNQDIEINNMCHILTGPKFGTDERDFTLRIYSDTPKKIVVKKGGMFNLCSFNQPNQIVEIGGEVTLVLEPGAKVMLNGGTLRITDNAAIVCTQTEDLDQLTNPTSVTSTDDIRVKFVGTGTVEFREGSSMAIGKWAYVGIETDDCINTTSLVFAVTEQSFFGIGGDEGEGGVLQIGNTTDKENSSVSFTLLINGERATFGIGRHACFGLGIGVADNTPTAQNDWLVGNLYNTKEVTILMPNGAFAHNQTYAGSDDKASLFAIADSQDTTFTFAFDTIKSTILGGGNIALINSQDAPYNLINPVVQTTDFNYPYANIPEPPFVLPGIMSSKSFLKDMFGIHKIQLDNTGLGLYGYLKVVYDQNSNSIFATAGPNENNKTIVGYVTQGTIMRPEINSILSRRGTDIDHEFSQRVGIVGVRLNDDTPSDVMQAFELPADALRDRIPGMISAEKLQEMKRTAQAYLRNS